MFHIRSTYDEWAPEYDEYPEGRAWSGEFSTYDAAWESVVAYLYTRGWSGPADAPCAFGHTEPTAHYGDTTILNDAETIEITD